MATSSKKTTNVVRIPSGVNMAHNPFTFGNTESYTTTLTPSFLKYGGLLINGLAESYEDPMTGKTMKRWIPRPVLGNPFSTAANGTSLNNGDNVRGVGYWSFAELAFVYTTEATNNGVLRANVQGSNLTAADIEITGQSTTDDTWMGNTEFWDGTNNYFVSSIGLVRPWYTTTSVVTAQIADTDCPSGSGTSPYIAYLDGALFIAKNNKIHNSEFADITAWPGYSRAMEQFPSRNIALARHKNSIVSFGFTGTEFFFNAGYSGTSPLNRQESFANPITLHNPFLFNTKTFAEQGDQIFFLGGDNYHQTSYQVGFYKIDNFKVKKLSSYYIDKLLQGASFLGPVSSFYYDGHLLTSIVVRLDNSTAFDIGASSRSQTSNIEFSLIYDDTENVWSIWTARYPSTQTTKSFNIGESSGTNYSQSFGLDFIVNSSRHLAFGYHADTRNNYILQSPHLPIATSGSISAPVYKDYSDANADVDFMIRYQTIDFGSMKDKYISKAYLTGLQNLDSGTPADINMYVFNSIYKESTGAYPTAIAMKSYNDSVANNLSTGKKFIIEKQWSGGTVAGMDALELHVIEGEN